MEVEYLYQKSKSILIFIEFTMKTNIETNAKFKLNFTINTNICYEQQYYYNSSFSLQITKIIAKT